jgi:anti-sigma regulatory factor (Ser/Thr protein kinase)
MGYGDCGFAIVVFGLPDRGDKVIHCCPVLKSKIVNVKSQIQNPSVGGTGMGRVSREFSSELRQLPEMRAFLRECCRDLWHLPADQAAIAQIELALDEAATNIILHAYEGEKGRPVEVMIEAGEDRISVTLYHCGRDFDPECVEPPVFDGSRESGFGLYLIQESVDEVHYFHDDCGRCGICLVKKRP